MTRFARAKGSKASNERKEEDATPWYVMRQQLLEQSNSKMTEINEISPINLRDILKDKTDDDQEVWSEFCESESSKKKSKFISVSLKRGKEKHTTNLLEDGNKKRKKIKKEKEKGKVKDNKSVACIVSLKESTKKKIVAENKIIPKNSQRGTKTIKRKQSLIKEQSSNIANLTKAVECNKVVGDINCISEEEKMITKINQSSSANRNKKIREQKDMSVNIEKKQKPGQTSFGFTGNNKRTNRWQENHRPKTIIANGRTIKMIRYDGFWVKMDDADELRKLRKTLLFKRIPKEKVEYLMKLERRKAEKALTREKKSVCFHCRKSGHKLSDCPDIKNPELGKSGMCFKCGSTEHTHFQCKVVQKEKYRFAVCFICKEQGHIVKQCPQNFQGQYPKGGSCHLCGEVTHLRKDCPKATDEHKSNTLTVSKLKGNHLEDIGEETDGDVRIAKLKKKKVVKF